MSVNAEDLKNATPLIPMQGSDEEVSIGEDGGEGGNDEEEFQIVEVGDDEEGDERVARTDDEEDHELENRGRRNETVEEKRERRRRERKNAKQRKNALIQGQAAQLEEMRQQMQVVLRQNQELAVRTFQQEVSRLDADINQLDSQIREAESIEVASREAQNVQDEIEARRVAAGLKAHRENLAAQRVQITGSNPGEKIARIPPNLLRNQPPAVDTKVVELARAWHAKHPWYDVDPNSDDEDSGMVRVLERSVLKDGYNPRTQAYWDELENRMKKRMPDKFQARKQADDNHDDDLDDDDSDDEVEVNEKPAARSKATEGGPRRPVPGAMRPLKKNEVYITPARKQAMIESGAWHDKEKRARQLKAYAEYDRVNGRNRR